MSKPLTGNKSDFLVTFITTNKAVTKKLSEVLKNKDNNFYRYALMLPEQFTLPLFSELANEGGVIATRYYVSSQIANVASLLRPFIKDTPFDYRPIQDGDYISFKDERNETVVRALFISTANIKLGYKKYPINKNSNIFIGRDAINDISFGFSDYISREKHIAIRVDENGSVYIEDLKRSTGVFVNGKAVHSQKIELLDEIFVMGLSIVNFGKFVAVRDLSLSSKIETFTDFTIKTPLTANSKKYFVRAPRILKSLDTDVFEIDAPPNPPSADKTPAILIMGPSITMAMVMLASVGVMAANAMRGGAFTTVITSGIMATGMLLGAILWPSLLRSYQKHSRKVEEKNRQAKYKEYIEQIDKSLSVKKERAVRLLNDDFNPSPSQLCKLLDDESSRLHLWERSFEDEDFLAVRLGIGQRSFDVKIETPKHGFQMIKDNLRSLPHEIAEKYSVLSDVPVTINLLNSKVNGVFGSKAVVRNFVDKIILNIASLHSYDEVKLIIVTSESESSHYDYAKNIPHTWSNDKKMRYFATNKDEVHIIFNAIDDIVKEREIEKAEETIALFLPYFVFIVTSESLVENEPLLRFIENPENCVGILSVFAYDDFPRLPKNCRTIIQTNISATDGRGRYYSKNKNNNELIEFSPDVLNNDDLTLYMEKLTKLPVKIDSRSLSVPERVSFLQMFGVGNVSDLRVESRWNNNDSARSLATPIGLTAGGIPFLLDIHEAYHGSHGLVAGTTGAGKSEFLQALILSLAINYSPNEIAFVLVDFKGGDMARPFMATSTEPALPHLAAVISNLSVNILYRALISFDAEIKSRQRLFNEAASLLGTAKLDINSYHRYYKAGRLPVPLPHLVIIIDEFAQLKEQRPDFLEQLKTVAQVGRSLGIHLILATQKPGGGTVDPQIWSNSRFKVCLKVANKDDSNEMIGKPIAALIKNPGRCFVQVGYDEIFECVQSGYSGANYIHTKTYMPDDDISVELVDNTATALHSEKLDLGSSRTDITQLEATVKEIANLASQNKLNAKPLWKDLLPEKILVNKLQKGNKTLLRADIGLVDNIKIQEQKPLTIDIEKSGHIAVYGASGMGKTTFLQTLVFSLVYSYEYTPDELNIYALDFSGRNLGYLSVLPHTGGVVFEDEVEKIAELAKLLQGVVNERKRIFASNNCGTFSEYHANKKQHLPAFLVLIENYAYLHEKHLDLSDRFLQIISTGRAYGIYFVITGNTKNSINYRVAEHLSTSFTMKMNDEGSYFDIHNARPPLIPEDIKGRGITIINKEFVEFQIALASGKETETERVVDINCSYTDIAKKWKGLLPVMLSETSNEAIDGHVNNSEPIKFEPPISNLEVMLPDEIDLNHNTLLIGTSMSGALNYGLELEKDFKLVVCADSTDDFLNIYEKLIKNATDKLGSKVIFLDDDERRFASIATVDKCRYIAGCNEFDLHESEEFKTDLNNRLNKTGEGMTRLFLIIPEFNRFFSMATEEQADFMRKITKNINSEIYGVCYICGFNTNSDKNGDILFYDLIVDADNYLFCPRSYQNARNKITGILAINDVKASESYFSQREGIVKIRW